MYKRLIEQFQMLLQKEKLQKKERYQRGEDFNIFRVMRMQSNEVYTHSALIAELLNPKGSHGCGDTFLKILIEQNPTIFPVGFNTANAKTIVELVIGEIKDDEGGRIDIVIESGNQAVIIENKIHAEDKKYQLLRYYNYAYKKYGKENYRLLYLTLDGKLPSDDSIENEYKNIKLTTENEDFYCISYVGEIKRWLEACLKEAVTKPMVREIILQYLNLIKKLTHTEDMENNVKKELLDLCSNPQNVEVLLWISNNFASVIQSIMKEKFVPVLNEIAQENGFMTPYIEDNGKDWLNTTYMCFAFRKKNWNDFEICFEFQDKNMERLVSGFRYRDIDKGRQQIVTDEYKQLKSINLSNQQVADRWPCYHYFSTNDNWITQTMMQKIIDGSIKDEIQEELLMLTSKAEKLGISL